MKNDFTRKTIWDLLPEEIDFVYEKLQMNNYIYAALQCYYSKMYPLNTEIKLRSNVVPDTLKKSTEFFLELVPYIGNYDPSIVRTNYVFRSYNLFTSLENVLPDDIAKITNFLSHLAFVPIIAEKDDNILIWPYLVSREITKDVENVFAHLKNKKHDLSVVLKQKEADELPNDLKILKYVHTAISVILTFFENEKENDFEKLLNGVEENLFNFEKEFGIVKEDNLKEGFNTGTQIRWRGTLYLYGGSIFESMGKPEKAYEWYLKGINTYKLLGHLPYYLTSFKAIERLISAYRIGKKLGYDIALLKELIDLAFVQALNQTAEYAKKVQNFIKENQTMSLRGSDLNNGKERMQYSNESVRELFFLSLYYNKVVNGVDYSELNYNQYFEY